MRSDELVSDFGNSRESRDVIVTPRQPSSRRPISQRAIDGFRGKKSFAVRLNQSHRPRKLFGRNFRESVGDLLVRCVIDLTASDYLPALDPQPTENTFTVPDQERLGWRLGNAKAHSE